MKTILISAFACRPGEGSEPGYGWNWCLELAIAGFEVHCITHSDNKKFIEEADIPNNLFFYYVLPSSILEKTYKKSVLGMYLRYMMWQWSAYKKSIKLHELHNFNLVHHVTWGSLQLGSFFYKLKIPFIFGPVGGGQMAPKQFKKYFLNHWHVEIKRNIISSLMLLLNPACKGALKGAKAVLVSNPETRALAIRGGAKEVFDVLDTALPISFFPMQQVVREYTKGKIRLLWVGRFLPRKGILLLLDVMKELKDYPGITLTVVGDGEMRDNFLHKLSQYELENSVFWHGSVPHHSVKKFYREHDVFLYTSLRESGGIQLVEAMSYSLPVVTLNLHGPAVIIDGSRGIKCQCEHPEQAVNGLVNAILHLYNNPEEIQKKGNAAYLFALEQTWGKKIENVAKHIY